MAKKRAAKAPRTRKRPKKKAPDTSADVSAPTPAPTAPAEPPPPPEPVAPEPTAGVFPLVNRIQLGQLLGVHPDTVTDYVRKGMPTITAGGHGKESVYDAVVCLDWWRQGQGKNVKDVAQARSYESTAKLNEMKLAEKKGELLPRATVIAEGQQYTRAWSAQVRGLPRRLELAGVIERHQVKGVAAECRDMLTEIAGWKTSADLKRAAQEPAA